jgi:hypothetical protein
MVLVYAEIELINAGDLELARRHYVMYQRINTITNAVSGYGKKDWTNS